MTTVSRLKSFNEAEWFGAADSFSDQGERKARQADSLNGTADAIEEAWRDEIGAMTAARHREYANAITNSVTLYEQAAEVLRDNAPAMAALRDQLLDVITFADREDVLVLDDGSAMPRIGSMMDPTRWARQLSLARAIGALTRSILHRAGALDGMVALALWRIYLSDLPYFDGGPLDMSDEGIRQQVELSSQGSYGFCAFLAPLMALGEANPSLFQENMRWDPATETYLVTLHDPETGAPVEVRVDPRDIPRDGDDLEGANNSVTGEPNFLSIYEQALRQQFPEIDSTNFPQAMRIITGREVEEVRAVDTSFDEIRETVEANPPGAAMVATTGAADPQDVANVPEEKRVVPGHAYAVEGFTDDGQIILRNTWGPDGGMMYDEATDQYLHCPGTVTLTEDEYQRWLNGTMLVDNP